MRPYVRLAFVAPLLAVCQVTVADSSVIDAVTKDVKEVCTQPATQGQHWSAAVKSNREGGVTRLGDVIEHLGISRVDSELVLRTVLNGVVRQKFPRNVRRRVRHEILQ